MKFILIPGHQIAMICDAPSASYADTQSIFGAGGSHNSTPAQEGLCYLFPKLYCFCPVSRFK